MQLPHFNDQRICHRNPGCNHTEGSVVLYWMQRSQRILDNPAFQVAADLANLWEIPLVVGFCLDTRYPGGQIRHFDFMLRGLDEVSSTLEEHSIPFLVVNETPVKAIKKWIESWNIAAVFGDENPLRHAEMWRQTLAEDLHVPFLTIDSDVIVPTRVFAKEEYAARTLRPKIHRVLEDYLTLPPFHWPRYQEVLPGSLLGAHNAKPSQWADLQSVPNRASILPDYPSGTEKGLVQLEEFVTHTLARYDTDRNQPTVNGTSQLSPFLHFGQLGPHTIAREIQASEAPQAAKKSFLEELIVRRELAVNFVHYNANYDNFAGIHSWAQKSLNEHRADPREYTYSLDVLESGHTHDPLWNAAQRQMVTTGWMHGYVRMYWAKKILEWTETPEQAWEWSIDLNDTYSLDGRDPNGYTGIAWALGGKHDRAWGPERPIFGKVRYMSLASTGRKFDSQRYIQRFS